MKELFDKQVALLKDYHFLILYWIAKAESLHLRYNITNVYDDLKHLKITRTKQNAVAYIESLTTLCFISMVEEHNRKNLYITNYGAKALELLYSQNIYSIKPSNFLEG